MRIMSAFREGKLPDRFGVRPTHTLRTFIARWLHCDAMRITKKFAGADSTGKHVYRRDMEMTSEEKKKVSQQISMLEKKFIQKLLAVQKSRAKRHAKGKRKRGKTSAVQSAHAVGMVGAAPFRGEVSMVTNPYVQLQHKQAVLQPGGVKRVMSEQTSMVTKKQKKKKPEKKKTTYSKEIGGTPKTSSIRAKEPSHTQQSPTDLQEPLAKRQKPTKNMSSRIGTPEKVPDEPSKVDGAAGLLMLFANESPSPATK